MRQNKLKIVIQFLLLITCLSVVLGLKESTDSVGLVPLVDEMKVSFIGFEQSTRELQKAVALLKKIPKQAKEFPCRACNCCATKRIKMLK